MRKILPLFLAAGIVLGFVTVLSVETTADDAKKSPKPYEMVAPLAVIMDQADTVFYDLEVKLEKEKFKTIKNDALFLAEMANIYKYAKDYLQEKKWQDSCAQLQGELLKLSESAGKKDGAAVKTLWTAVEKTCDSCHEEFRD